MIESEPGCLCPNRAGVTLARDPHDDYHDSKILGHANPAITMGIYAHELVEDLEQVREAMAKFA